MSGGLVALLDDIATLAKAAAASIDDVGLAAGKASAKAAGVVVDDTAVTPQYVRGVAALRELPIIKQIAIGSLRNKLIFILPAALLLSQFAPWLLTPILMVGGTYLCFEGAEKIWGKLAGHEKETTKVAAELGPEEEKKVVSGAIRTDFILSAEIMVISLNEVAQETFLRRLVILVVVALFITAVVYGLVAILVKMDDIGLKLAESASSFQQRFGRGLVKAMPHVMTVISVIGTAAMLWVGGHLILVGADELGLHAPYALVHGWEEAVQGVAGIGGFLAWLVNTLASFVIGLLVGAVVVAILHFLPFGPGKHDQHGEHRKHDGHGEEGASERAEEAHETATGGEPGPFPRRQPEPADEGADVPGGSDQAGDGSTPAPAG